MRFLFIFSTSTLTGQAAQSYNIIKFLCKNGHKVWVVSDQNREGNLNEYIERCGAITIKNISVSNKNKLIFSKYCEINKLRSLILDLKPDFVASSFSNDHFSMRIATRNISYHFKTIRFFHSKRVRKDFIHKKLYSGTDLFIFYDFDIFVEFKNKYPELCSRIFLLPTAIDSNIYELRDRMKARKEFGIDSNSIVIGYVGMFQKGRMHKLLIDAFSEFKKNNSNALLFMVGGGETLNEIKQYAQKRIDSGNIIFTNYVDDNRLVDAYNCMDIFLLLKGGHDSSLRMLYEAQSCGVYILTYKSYPASRLIETTCYGSFINRMSARDISDSISQSIRHIDYERRGEVHRKVMEDFDIEKCGRSFLRICEIDN